jgi:hypothetical protein
MWDHDDEPDDDWQPLRTRRAGSLRMIALLIVAAMVIALIIPVLLRLLRGGGEEPEPTDGVRTMISITEQNRLGPDSGNAVAASEVRRPVFLRI